MYVPLVVNSQSIGVICLDCFCPKQFFGREDLLLVNSFAHQLALAIANHELQLTLKHNADVLERLPCAARAGDDDVEKNIGDLVSGSGKDLLRVIEDYIDAAPLLEDGQRDAEQKHSAHSAG